jgi:hypothetical protein
MLLLPVPPSSNTYEMWVRQDAAFGPFDVVTLRDSYAPSMSGTWVWDFKPKDEWATSTPEKSGMTIRDVLDLSRVLAYNLVKCFLWETWKIRL